jgi:hypothetical protein
VPTPTTEFCNYLLLFFFISPSSCVYRPLNYRMIVLPPFCGFSWISLMCSFLRFTCYPPRSPPPASISLRTYYVAPCFLPCGFCDFLSSPLSFLVGCSQSLYFYLLFRCFRYRGFTCPCCDEIYLNADKVPSISLIDGSETCAVRA